MQEKLARLKDKFEADSALAEKLFSLETPDEVQSLLKEQGLEFSLDEINSLRDALVKTVEKGELTDDDLADVSGGIAVTTVIMGAALVVSAVDVVHKVSRGRW